MPELVASIANLAFIDGIGFDPFFRGLLSVVTGIVVLIGSTYLIVATNTGTRLGFLVSAAALFGWMFLMGIIWTIYGIGWVGDAPVWSLREVNVDDADDLDDGLLFSETTGAAVLTRGDGNVIAAGGLGDATFDRDAVLDRVLPADADELEPAEFDALVTSLLGDATTVAEIPDPDVAQEAALLVARSAQLDDWRYLVASDAIRGEAQASADAFLVEEGVFGAGEFVPDQFGAFTIDGKPVLAEDANLFDRVVHFFDETFLNPAYDEELIVIQVRAAVPQPTLPGEAPPVATADPNAPLVSVIMERDRGGPLPAFFSGLRFTPAMFTLANGAIFLALAWNMHLRDQRESKIRAAAAAA